jgi:hypothetical protein
MEQGDPEVKKALALQTELQMKLEFVLDGQNVVDYSKPLLLLNRLK